MQPVKFISVVLLILFVTPTLASSFDEDEIRELISGKTAHIYHKKKDLNAKRYFSPDGTLYEEHEVKGFRKGSWTVEDNKLCFSLGNSGAKCRPFIEKNDEIGTSNKKGKKLIVVFEEIINGNIIKMPKNKTTGPAITEELVTIPTRKDVSQTFLLIQPSTKPKGVVILYPGHEGVVRFKKIGNKYNVDNVGGGLTASEKSRLFLSKAGYVVAVLAPPSDQSEGMDTDFRLSEEHAIDSQKVIEYLHTKYNQDVILQGHCRSSFSPSAVATRLKNNGIKGLILSSTRSQGKHGSVMSLQKNAITVPILLVHHKQDPCDGTPYKNINKVKSFYESSSRKVDLISVTGGDGDRPAFAPGCSGGHHAFKGQQKPVMKGIINWLNGNPIPETITD